MGSRATRLLMLAGASGIPGMAAAAPWIINASATLRAGVDTNPFLEVPSRGKTGQVGVSVNGIASRTDAKSTTTAEASADVGQYFGGTGRNTNYLARLSRTQSLTEHLNAFVSVGYTSTLNPQTNFGFDPRQATVGGIDYLTIGTRSERFDANGGFDWQLTGKDKVRFSGNGSHATYSGIVASDYDQYGGQFGYLHTLDPRTQVGVQLSANSVQSSGYPSAQSYQTFLQVVRQIGVAWSFDGSAGLIFQRSHRSNLPGTGSGNGTTFGFNGSLCGNYPRYDLCFTFSRQAAPSGIGGLRTDTQFRITGSYKLTELSQIHLAAAVDVSGSADNTLLPNQRFYDLTVSYSRTISPRLSIGATGRYQRRETDTSVFSRSTSPSNFSVNGNLIYNFGRLSG